MHVLQADEEDLHAELELVRLGLNALAEFIARREARGGHDLVHVDADEVADDFTGGDLLEQFAGVAEVVGPGANVLNLVLHRDGDAEQVDRRRFLAGDAVGGTAVRLATGHEQIELLLVVRDGPEDCRFVPFLGFVALDSDVEHLNLLRAKAQRGVDGPGHLRVEAGAEDFTAGDRIAEAFEQGFFARLDVNEACRGGEDEQVSEDQPRHGALQELEEPGVRNLEAELVIQGVRDGGEHAFGVADEADDPAVVEQASDLALDSRAIDFQQQRQEIFDGERAKQDAEDTRRDEVRRGEAGLHGRDAGDGQREEIRAEQDLTRAGLQQAMLLQSCEAGGVLAEQEEHERQHAEDGHADERLVQRGREGEFAEPVPQPPRSVALNGEQQNREPGDEELLELFARTTRGEGFGFLRVEEGGTGCAAFGHFIELQLLDAFAVFHPHLEPAHHGDEHAHAEEAGRDLPGDGFRIERDAQCRDAHHEQEQEIRESVLLDIAFHGQLNSRSSKRHSATASDAPTYTTA